MVNRTEKIQRLLLFRYVLILETMDLEKRVWEFRENVMNSESQYVSIYYTFFQYAHKTEFFRFFKLPV